VRFDYAARVRPSRLTSISLLAVSLVTASLVLSAGSARAEAAQVFAQRIATAVQSGQVSLSPSPM
jgi:hypothetical protein